MQRTIQEHLKLLPRVVSKGLIGPHKSNPYSSCQEKEEEETQEEEDHSEGAERSSSRAHNNLIS